MTSSCPKSPPRQAKRLYADIVKHPFFKHGLSDIVKVLYLTEAPFLDRDFRTRVRAQLGFDLRKCRQLWSYMYAGGPAPTRHYPKKCPQTALGAVRFARRNERRMELALTKNDERREWWIKEATKRIKKSAQKKVKQ